MATAWPGHRGGLRRRRSSMLTPPRGLGFHLRRSISIERAREEFVGDRIPSTIDAKMFFFFGGTLIATLSREALISQLSDIPKQR
ncbi:hypothetical protein HPP92_002352 [Vanilla planifolia]|uniref:Uncharacterized protein n=1 Tax=Vanilla planifolia TaxID=51239 RepID=A0A835RSV6_VANPL|nr:hypothetical protein HPP92_002352 [Vanilla planifolia]